MGYFSRVTQNSQGPWFREWFVEEDGLEYFYVFSEGGHLMYLLSNNIPLADREKLQRTYFGLQRNNKLAMFGSLWLGVESVVRFNYLKKLAPGWRILSIFGLAAVYMQGFKWYTSLTYGPIISAFFRKYRHLAKDDPFKIEDRKREYFEIDTTQYMNYTYETLDHVHPINHGPQPDGEAMDSTWLIEMDKFLKCEPNKMKEHKNYVNYHFEYIDKSFPSVENAHALFHQQSEKPNKI